MADSIYNPLAGFRLERRNSNERFAFVAQLFHLCRRQQLTLESLVADRLLCELRGNFRIGPAAMHNAVLDDNARYQLAVTDSTPLDLRVDSRLISADGLDDFDDRHEVGRSILSASIAWSCAKAVCSVS